MTEWLNRFRDELWMILVDSGVWLILGFALAGVVHALVPMGWIRRQLGGRGIVPIAKAAALGLPMPLCSCSVIPVAASLRGAGAGKGASAAFTISTPQTGEESIPLTWALFGPVFAIARPIVAIATAFTAGVLIDKFAPDTPEGASKGTSPKPAGGEGAGGCCSHAGEPVSSCCAPTEAPKKSCCSHGAEAKSACCAHESEAESSCCAHEGEPAKSCCSHPAGSEGKSVGGRLVSALRYGFVTLPRDLAPWLITGLLLAAVVATAVPKGWIGEHLGSGMLPMVLTLVVGVPLYICATSSTPLAFALVTAGLSPGAALVLLLAGPATNTATMAWVLKDLGKRALVIYLAVIGAFALASGLVFDAFLSGMIRLASGGGGHEHVVGVMAPVGAVALSLLLFSAAIMRVAPKGKPGRHAGHGHRGASETPAG